MDHPLDRRWTGAPPPSLDPASRATWTRNLPSVALLCAVAYLASATPTRWYYAGPAAVLAIAFTGLLPRPRTPDMLALATALWAFMTLIWTRVPELHLAPAYLYGCVALVFIAVRHVACGPRHLLLIGYSYLAGCVATLFRLITGAEEFHPVQRQGTFDLSVRFGVDGVNYNHTAYTLVTGALVALLLLRVHPHRLVARLLLNAFVAGSVYGVVLTGTRGALIGLVVGGVYLVLSRLVRRVAWLTAAVVTPLLLVLVPLGATGDRQLLWLEGLLGRSTGDLAGRLYVWPEALSTWSESFLTGIGVGAFPIVNPYRIGAHNLLLTLGNDLGLVGVLLYAGVFVSAIAAGIVRDPAVRPLAGLFLTMLLPIWLTGHWESSQGVWLCLAILSVATPGSARHIRSASDTAPRPGVGHPVAAHERFPAAAVPHGRVERTSSRKAPSGSV